MLAPFFCHTGECSMAEYLRTRNGNFYLRLRVPADLRSTFPNDIEILKSLRTKDPKTARLSL